MEVPLYVLFYYGASKESSVCIKRAYFAKHDDSNFLSDELKTVWLNGVSIDNLVEKLFQMVPKLSESVHLMQI